jgi:hypothetical protein
LAVEYPRVAVVTTIIDPRDNQIAIGGITFRIRDMMKVTNLAVPPNPIAFGDTTRSSETQAMIQMIQSSYTGGSGKFTGNTRTDAERSWTSGWNTKYREQLSFPSEVVDLGIPSGASDNISDSISHNNIQYFATTNRLYGLEDATQTLYLEQLFGSNIVSMCAFKNILYVAYAAGYGRLIAGVWTGVAQACGLFAVWNNTMYNVFHNGQEFDTTRTSASNPEVWSASVGVFPSDIVVHQLQVYMDANSTSALYAMTNKGPWIYNFNNNRWDPTDFVIPTLPAGETCRSVRFRDGKLYLSTGGMSMASLQNGNPMVIGTMGPDRDDGVPVEEQGAILAVGSDLNFVYALTQTRAATPSSNLWTGGPQSCLDFRIQPLYRPCNLAILE